MLYQLLKVLSRIAIHFYCRKLVISHPERLKEKGPLLLACNHPNSFLDSVILDTVFEQPVWSLARGDAFKKPFYIKILSALKIMPVYRTSEGVENLSENYKTFEACMEIFRAKGVITIYSEGRCINEWHLRPLKKGTARLAIKAWEQGIPLKVLPVGINYSSFRKFGKNLFLNFGEIITAQHINMNDSDGQRNQSFNQQLERSLRQLVFEIPKQDLAEQKRQLEISPSPLKKALLAIPAILGLLLHAPLFLPIKNFTWRRTHDNDHYDSVMVGILLFAYPLYLILLLAIAFILFKTCWALALLAILPFTAWSYIQLKQQV